MKDMKEDIKSVYVRNYPMGYGTRENGGGASHPFAAAAPPDAILIPSNYRGELLRPQMAPPSEKENPAIEIQVSGRGASPQDIREQPADSPEKQYPAVLPDDRTEAQKEQLWGREDTLLLCAVGVLLFSGQREREGWSEDDIGLLLILLLLITSA